MQPIERDVETLRKIPLFAGLPTARLKLIAYTAEVVEFAPGEQIVRQGDPADAVYIVTEGEADVLLRDADGLRHRGSRRWAATVLFGETAVLSKGRRTATVRAKERVRDLQDLRGRVPGPGPSEPGDQLQVMTVLAQRLERSSALLQQLQSHS
jgi:CRP-like cAMP-binding protein